MDWKVVEKPEYPATEEEACSSYLNQIMEFETKAITLLAMDEEARTHTQLWEAVSEEALTDEFSKALPWNYCKRSFERAGAVTKCEITVTRNFRLAGNTAYALSEFGQDLQPLAAYQIKSIGGSEWIDSMYELLGEGRLNYIGAWARIYKTVEKEGKYSLPPGRKEALDVVSTTADWMKYLFSEEEEMPKPVEEAWNQYQENRESFRRDYVNPAWSGYRRASSR